MNLCSSFKSLWSSSYYQKSYYCFMIHNVQLNQFQTFISRQYNNVCHNIIIYHPTNRGRLVPAVLSSSKIPVYGRLGLYMNMYMNHVPITLFSDVILGEGRQISCLILKTAQWLLPFNHYYILYFMLFTIIIIINNIILKTTK